MEEHDDDHWEVDDEEVGDEVQNLICVQVEWPSHASKQIYPNACRCAPSFIFPFSLKSTDSDKESLELQVGDGGGGCRN